jgi:hypothetical protein
MFGIVTSSQMPTLFLVNRPEKFTEEMKVFQSAAVKIS